MALSPGFDTAFKVVRTLLYYDTEQGRWQPRVATLSNETVAAIVSGAGDVEYTETLETLTGLAEKPYDYK